MHCYLKTLKAHYTYSCIFLITIYQ